MTRGLVASREKEVDGNYQGRSHRGAEGPGPLAATDFPHENLLISLLTSLCCAISWLEIRIRVLDYPRKSTDARHHSANA
jgi:hypothetical protein